jgi:hypothetical protein
MGNIIWTALNMRLMLCRHLHRRRATNDHATRVLDGTFRCHKHCGCNFWSHAQFYGMPLANAIVLLERAELLHCK